MNRENGTFLHPPKMSGERLPAIYESVRFFTENIQSTVTKSAFERLKTYNQGFEKGEHNEKGRCIFKHDAEGLQGKATTMQAGAEGNAGGAPVAKKMR